MSEEVALRPVREDDLALLEDLTQNPEKTGEFEWFGWSDLRPAPSPLQTTRLGVQIIRFGTATRLSSSQAALAREVVIVVCRSGHGL